MYIAQARKEAMTISASARENGAAIEAVTFRRAHLPAPSGHRGAGQGRGAEVSEAHNEEMYHPPRWPLWRLFALLTSTLKSGHLPDQSGWRG